MKNIQIPNPCSENWETMSPQEKGRFCSACSQCVTDCTEKHQEEIQQIFIGKEAGTICGRFYSHQLHNPDHSQDLRTWSFACIPENFRINPITAAVFPLILFLTGCTKQKDAYVKNENVTGIKVENDIVENQNFVMGEMVMLGNDSIAKICKPDSSAVKYRY